MYTIKRYYVLFLFLVFAVLSGCGGSGGGAATLPTTTISGTVFAGPATGATLVVKDQNGTLVAGPITVTSGDGSFQINVPSAALRGALILSASGGIYIDEATETAGVALGTFSAYLAPGSAAGTQVTLDPASTIIEQLVAKGMTLAAAKQAFQRAFGFTPDGSVAPAFANISCSASTASRTAGLRAAFFSQLTKDLALGPEKQSELIHALAEDLSDGTLNGKNGAILVSTGSGTAIPEDVGVLFAGSAITFQTSQKNKSKLSGDKLEAPPFGKVSLTASYRVEYLVPEGGDLSGRDTFQFRVTKRSDGTPVTGLASDIVLTPLMVMGTMSSSSAWRAAVQESATPGTYTGTVYYSMATTGLDMYWRLSIAIGNETAVFYPSVAALPAGNTVSAKLSSNADKVGTSNRTYRLWRDTLAAANGTGYDLTVFVSSTDAGFAQPVFAGQQWTTPSLGLTTVELDISSDGSSWTALVPVGTSGRYTAAKLPLVAGSTSKYYLRLKINGTTYTTNGNVPDGNANPALSNGFASFSLTP